MISLNNVSKYYGSTAAVDDLTVAIHPGVVTGFLGPNGAGKSTTMRMILGLDRPSKGQALIDGRPYHQLRWPLRTVGAHINPQAGHPGRTPRSFLTALARSNRIAAQRVDAVLEQTGLTSVAGQRIKGFSLGMRQRLGIAAALLGEPEVLIFDEPMNGLDAEGIRWIRSLMQQHAHAGGTVFVSSHLMSEVQQVADHLVVIGRGQLISQAPMAELLAGQGRQKVLVRSPQAAELAGYARAEGLQVLASGDGIVRFDGASPRQIGELAFAHGVELHELSSATQSLEDIYTQLTEDAVQYAAAGHRTGADK